MSNIILIGMPGCGKSTMGVLLAKIAGYGFIDSDLLIQQREGRKLYRIIEEDGLDYFKWIENEVNASIEADSTVIATGGSVVYGDEAMAHLKEIGTVVYLKVPVDELERRIHNMAKRGIVMKSGETIKDLYAERTGLYEKYADVIIDCSDGDLAANAEAVARRLGLL